jgi:hypothetical protein
MKKLMIGMFVGVFMLASVSASFAEPTNPEKADNNPQTVAYYTSGDHGIAGEPDTHTGTDYVRQDGNSGNFDQWFSGTTTESDHTSEYEHSVWKSVGDSTSCPAGAVLVVDAQASWGNYLSPGNYCVFNNDANAH